MDPPKYRGSLGVDQPRTEIDSSVMKVFKSFKHGNNNNNRGIKDRGGRLDDQWL